MKYIVNILKFLILSILFFACNTEKNVTTYKNIYSEESPNLKIEFSIGKALNHPSFVIWAEDLEGNYLKTLFITKSYASGVFDHQMLGDTMWLSKKGESVQPAALPYWTHKKGFINDSVLVPTIQNPYVDAYSGATPQDNFSIKEKKLALEKYRILVEINQAWDWNKYWTNNKYPESNSYKHSAQPSIIYAVTVNSEDSIYYLNPIGHGDPKGESGKLFTNLSTLSTSKEIYSSIKLTINK